MKKTVVSLTLLLLSSWAQAQSLGQLQVNGQAGKFQIFQKVKAVRCEVNKRGVCDAAVFFDLNKPQSLPQGSYLVGFENSLHGGLVEIRAGSTTQLQLHKLTVPAEVRGQRIRLTRDLTSTIEQRKILQSMYYMNRHFFRLEKQNFGDLYLTGAWDRDFVQRFNYDICPKLSSIGKVEAVAQKICNIWNNATSPEGLTGLIEVSSAGVLTENWVMAPGDVFPSVHPQYLVATPVSEGESVAVFAGVYKAQSDEKGSVGVSLRVGM